MRIFRGFNHPGLANACALTIGNFDGVHRGHQAMLALLRSEAQHRGIPSCVLTFEPHPRDYFARRSGKPELAPARIANLRDKLAELEGCGVDECVVLRFNEALATLSAMDFLKQVLLGGLHAHYILVGDDFKFGSARMGDYDFLAHEGPNLGFDVARMNSYEVSKHDTHPNSGPSSLRVSSSAVRQALSQGLMEDAQKLLGRPYSISGHVVYGRQLGRSLNARTLNVRFNAQRPATQGIFVVRVHGLTEKALGGVANLGVRPTLDPSDVNKGQVLLETHILSWPDSLPLEGGYGKIIRVELLEKLHDELKYESLDALQLGIQRDVDQAKAWFDAHP
jgi:riboflavin kinase / FMN adenylyltransferase